MNWIIFLLLAYLLGSVPTSVWVSKSFYGFDIRTKGSNNAGATNVFRVLGKKAGTFVFIVDVCKGFLAVSLMIWSTKGMAEHHTALLLITAGGLSVFGHVFPVFASFKGGKGVATSLGVILALTPQAALLCMAIFLIIWLAFNYVSLGSIIAVFFYPIFQFFLYAGQSFIITFFSIGLALLVITAHKKNIQRLRAGNETKTYAFRKKN